MIEIFTPKEIRALNLDATEKRCLSLAIQGLKSDTKQGVEDLRDLLSRQGWSLTFDHMQFKKGDAIRMLNPGKFSRDPGNKGIIVSVPLVEGQPLPFNDQHTIDSIVHEFLWGRLYFAWNLKGRDLSPSDYETIKQKILQLDRAQQLLRSHWDADVVSPQKAKDRSDLTGEGWKDMIDKFLSSK